VRVVCALPTRGATGALSAAAKVKGGREGAGVEESARRVVLDMRQGSWRRRGVRVWKGIGMVDVSGQQRRHLRSEGGMAACEHRLLGEASVPRAAGVACASDAETWGARRHQCAC
jgi:hypothetical protein